MHAAAMANTFRTFFIIPPYLIIDKIGAERKCVFGGYS
jgi:hypothetical protein